MEVCKGGQAKNPPWTNTRFHHRLECQLDILAPKKMAHVSPPGQSIVPINPACLCQRSQPWGSLFGGRAPSSEVGLLGVLSSGQGFPEASHWKRRVWISAKGLQGWSYTQTVILTLRGVGNVCCQSENALLPQKSRHSRYVHTKWMGMRQCKDSLKTMWWSFRWRTLTAGRTDCPINGMGFSC